ncbi:hypothetical protein Dda_9102 [Drechslerella dactyloides]|uniref:WSC domain-containing protein n=1 Tax=Drechslerella dactyloides TaxID=74499 RepID=A0AAD6IQ51_DREDA|nr:hypothetical protein Dda_9102 [Drechslerella dactyloides]
MRSPGPTFALAIIFTTASLAAPPDSNVVALGLEKRTAANTKWDVCNDPRLVSEFYDNGCHEISDTKKPILDFQVPTSAPDNLAIIQGQMTQLKCLGVCRTLGTRYAAIKDGITCFCGSELNGKATQDVYEDSTFGDEVDTDSVNSVIRGYDDLGCYRDDGYRVVKFALIASDGSLEVGTWCFCGGALRPKSTLYDNQNGSCGYSCAGNRTQTTGCGGPWAMSVYYNEDLDSKKRYCLISESNLKKIDVPAAKPKRPTRPNKSQQRLKGNKPGNGPTRASNDNDNNDDDDNTETVLTTVTERKTITERVKNKPKTRTTTIIRVSTITRAIDTKPSPHAGKGKNNDRNDDRGKKNKGNDDDDNGKGPSGSKQKPGKKKSTIVITKTEVERKKVTARPAKGDDEDEDDNSNGAKGYIKL